MIDEEQSTTGRRRIQQTLNVTRQITQEKKEETQPKKNKEEHMRIYHQNVNGIGSRGREGVEEIITHIRNFGVAVRILVETNVEWTPEENRTFVERTKRVLRDISGKKVQSSIQATSCKW
jgi:hypothetical protein